MLSPTIHKYWLQRLKRIFFFSRNDKKKTVKSTSVIESSIFKHFVIRNPVFVCINQVDVVELLSSLEVLPRKAY